MKKATRSEKQGSQSQGENNSTSQGMAPSKIARILGHLLNAGPLNRFEAERIGDHCLNSTIAVLANAHRLAFVRQQERVPNRWGAPCVVTRYSLLTSEHDEARKVLACLKRTARRTTEG